MTRIDLHTPHLPQVRAAEKPDADRGHGADFLDHLRSDKPAVGERGSRQNAGTPLPDKPQASAGSENTVTRPSDATEEALTDDVGDGATAKVDTPLHTFRHAPVTIVDATTRARLFEQHWFANGYLSFLSDTDQPRASTATGVAGATPNEAFAAATTSEALTPVPSAPSGEPRRTVMAPWPVALESLASTADAPLHSIERLARTLGPLVAADQPWPERLLRMSQRPGGKAAIWVRDYKLAPHLVEPLVAHLLRLARQDGVALERVVVNGTIVWQSESIQGEV